MNAIFGETRYYTTGFSNWNFVGTGLLNGHATGMYCAGCNGSFLLDFTASSIGTGQGVFGVGLEILYNLSGGCSEICVSAGSPRLRGTTRWQSTKS